MDKKRQSFRFNTHKRIYSCGELHFGGVSYEYVILISVKHEFVINSHNVQVKKAMEKTGGGGGK